MFCIYCRNNEAVYGTYCRNCGRVQQRGANTGTIYCAYCRADNPSDATFCWNCGNQFPQEASRFTSDRIIQPGMPLPGALLGGSQTLAGNVPIVQGTPQASSIPLVQGTPSPLSTPLSNPGISQGAALSSSPQVSPPLEYPHQPIHHPGPPPIHHPEPPPVHPPVHHPGPPIHQPPPIHPPVHHPEPPPIHHHHPGPPPVHHHHPTHQHLGHVSTPQTSTIARRVATGGARAAGGLSRRAILGLLIGGAATVAVGGTAAYVVLASSSPDKTVLAYCNAYKSGDAQTAYNQLSSRLQNQTNQQKFTNNVQQISSIKPISDCSASTIQQNDLTATVTLKVTLFGISLFPVTINVKLIKENGVWKIDDGTLLSL